MLPLPNFQIPLNYMAFQPLVLRSLILFLIACQLVFLTGACEPVFSSGRVLCNEPDQPVETSEERETESEFSEHSELHSSRRGYERRGLPKVNQRFNNFDRNTPPQILSVVNGFRVVAPVIHGFRACRLC
jgi:hypothetical protein